jgi:hypothetical protein
MTSDYAEALKDMWDPVAEAIPLRFPPAVQEQHAALAIPQPAALPAVVQSEPQVYQPMPVEAGRPQPWQDPWVVRPVALGACIALAGEGVNLMGQGIRAAGPYLWALAGCLVALAGLVALIKGHGAPKQPGGTSITIHGDRNRIGNVR